MRHLNDAYQRVPRRDPVAEAQIVDARGPDETPLDAFVMVDELDAAIAARHAEVLAAHPPGPPEVTLTGDEAHHYLTLKAASKRALEAQNAHASAGAELRDAIQALCKAMAPG